jgi:hypothetical protein
VSATPAASDLPIVDTPTGLTVEWVDAALHGAGWIDARDKVTTVRLSPVGTGQMCDCVRIELGYERVGSEDDRRPRSLVAKLPAADPTSRATAQSLRSYEVEVRFYQELAPTLPVRTPRVVHADIDVATSSFDLLLEDLAPARAGDQLAGCTPADAEVAVDELVRLHAPRWDDPALADLEWLHRDPESGRAFLLMILPGLWDGFRERYADQLAPIALDAGNVLFSHLDRFLADTGAPLTVAHGDFRLDNLLFAPDPAATGLAADGSPGGRSVAVVDWQTALHGSGPQDVAYFIGAGLVPEVRREVEEDLVRRYHRGLGEAGVSGYDWDRCWHDYRRGTWAGMLMAVAASMLVERTERGDQMFMTMAHRHATQISDLDAAVLLTDD